MEIIGFLIQTIGIALLIILILNLPLWFIAKKKGKYEKLDYIFPFVPFVFYIILNVLSISKQSIANLIIETTTVIFITLIAYSIKIFSNHKKKTIIVILLIVITIFILLMPLIVE